MTRAREIAKLNRNISSSLITGAIPDSLLSGVDSDLVQPLIPHAYIQARETNDFVKVAEASGGGAGNQAFNGCFTSTYRKYLILASISLDTTAECYVRLQDVNNNQRTSAVYYYPTMRNYQANGSNAHDQDGVWGSSQFSPERDILANNPHASYRIWVFNPTDSNIKTHMQMDFFCQAPSVMNQTKGSCVYDSFGSEHGFRFVAANGNIKTNSQFKIYGLK